eukprot:9475741-Alexandrium_andersonii.AAC.1
MLYAIPRAGLSPREHYPGVLVGARSAAVVPSEPSPGVLVLPFLLAKPRPLQDQPSFAGRSRRRS